MISSPLTMSLVTVAAMAIVLGALAVHGMYNPSYDSTSEMLQSVVPGEVLG